MLDSARSWVTSHRDVSQLVQEAERFSVRLPVVGRVHVPPPEQLAFYGALGLLAAIQVIDWPVALAVGVGHAVTTRHLARQGEEPEAAPAALAAPAKKAPAAKTPAKKAPAKKAPAKKSPAKKAAKKAPAKRS